MPRQALLFTAVGGLLLAVSPAHAQTLRLDVPFDFVVNHTVLPAGEYVIQTYHHVGQHVSITSVKNGTGILSLVADAAPSSLRPRGIPESRVVFRRAGDQYVLHQVWTEGLGHFHDLVHGDDVPEIE
jgi:hypothetical protein